MASGWSQFSHHHITLIISNPLKNMLLEITIMIVSQGDLDKLRDGVVFLTVHDVGASYEVESLLKILNSHTFIRWPD